jgi:HPt (histidine-containing phosphotransfer) domain-containing protein
MPDSPITSEFAEDADFQDLLEIFYDSLAEQRSELARAFAEKQWDELSRKSHQLKGAGGGYGFPGLTAAALALETASDRQQPWEIQEGLDDLLTYLDRILAR